MTRRSTSPVTHNLVEQRIAELLRGSGIQFESSPALGGIRPDFLVTTSEGQRTVIEVKAWPGDAAHLHRAAEQAEFYRRATGADNALVVVPSLTKGLPASGVFTEQEFVRWVEQLGMQAPQRSGSTQRVKKKASKRPATRRKSAPQKNIFAAMPFSAEFDDVYFVAMVFAALDVGATCVRVDQEEFSGDIVEEIHRCITGCTAVIADLSRARANVLYELGYARGLRKPSVPISSTPLGELPFDVRNWNTLSYKAGQTHEFRERLAERLAATIRDR